MVSKILVAIPYSADNAILAERLCDWIYQLNGKMQQGGHCLLVIDGDVHQELREKVLIAAKVAFAAVDEVTATEKDKEGDAPWVRHNRLFLAGALAVQIGYKWPFVWLEPESVPTSPIWLEEIHAAYDSQARRYMGQRMKRNDNFFMARVGIYPMNAHAQLSILIDDKAPFEEACGHFIYPRCTRGAAFQKLDYQGVEDIEKVREDALVVSGDSTGSLIETMRPRLIPNPQYA